MEGRGSRATTTPRHYPCPQAPPTSLRHPNALALSSPVRGHSLHLHRLPAPFPYTPPPGPSAASRARPLAPAPCVRGPSSGSLDPTPPGPSRRPPGAEAVTSRGHSHAGEGVATRLDVQMHTLDEHLHPHSSPRATGGPGAPSSAPSVLCAPLGTPGHRLSSQAWGPLGTALPVTSCQGGRGRVNKASRWLPVAARPWERPSRRGHGRAGGGSASPIGGAPATRLRLPAPTAPLSVPDIPTKGLPAPTYRGGS